MYIHFSQLKKHEIYINNYTIVCEATFLSPFPFSPHLKHMLCLVCLPLDPMIVGSNLAKGDKNLQHIFHQWGSNDIGSMS
jgi:hypothetical protein